MSTSTLTVREIPSRPSGVVCIAFKRRVSGSLRGFADLHLPRARLKIFDCPVHQSGDRRWVALPAKPQLDRDRQVITDEHGKVKYTPVVAWDDDRVRWTFSDAAVAAVEAYDPAAFDDGEG